MSLEFLNGIIWILFIQSLFVNLFFLLNYKLKNKHYD